ncbi:MAG TPA: O-antigen ligase family protein, partial [Longilinea sp.]|nr:O-antigen ligase family protein [Longilinea sp.]
MASTETPKKSTFLVSIIAVLTLIWCMMAGGFIWGSAYFMHITTLAALILLIGYVLFRALVKKASLPAFRSDGLVWLAMGVLLYLLIRSPQATEGFIRVARLISLGALLYILLDLFSYTGLANIALRGLLVVSGLALLLAALETYAVYYEFWQSTGSFSLPPLPYRLIGILGHPNALMGLVNLCAPVALIVFFQNRYRLAKAAAAAWLLLFLIAIPFSSSRGGWMGAAASFGLLALWGLWLWKPWSRIKKLPVWGWVLAGTGGLGVVSAGVYAAYRFWVAFAAHPSHGSSLFGGRSEMWEAAWVLFRQNILTGIGPGRYAFGFLQVMSSTPPAYWPSHSHGLLVQTAAEFGLLGLLVGLALLAALIVWMIDSYRKLPLDLKWTGRAVFVGLLAFCVQMIVDDFTFWMSIMVPVVILLAWMGSSSGGVKQFHIKASLGWLCMPVGIVLVIVGWVCWTYAPLNDVLEKAQDGEWDQAAASAAFSAERDTHLAFYQFEAGVAYAQAYGQNQNSLYLNNAIGYLESSVALEPSISQAWADLGVLYSQAGLMDQAVEALLQAESLAHNEPSYPLNLAIIYESMGETTLAELFYTRVLELSPWSVTLPFWTQTELRTRVVENWSLENAQPENSSSAYWQQACFAIAEGRYTDAEHLLAYSRWMGEPGAAILFTEGLMAEAQGRIDEANSTYQEMVNGLLQPQLNSVNSFAAAFGTWVSDRTGFSADLVPGYYQLQPEEAQFISMVDSLIASGSVPTELAQSW